MPVAAASGVVHDEAQHAVITLPASASGVVVGAPGTGKTRTLVARVAELVASGVDPDAVLVLTPSRQTATALQVVSARPSLNHVERTRPCRPRGD